MSDSIFVYEKGGHICYARNTDERLKIVNNCHDKKGLLKELDGPDIQVTVMKAIITRVKKLERETQKI